MGRVSDGSRVALTPLPCPQHMDTAQACAARSVYAASALRDASSAPRRVSPVHRPSHTVPRSGPPYAAYPAHPGSPLIRIRHAPRARPPSPRCAPPHPPSAVVNLAPHPRMASHAMPPIPCTKGGPSTVWAAGSRFRNRGPAIPCRPCHPNRQSGLGLGRDSGMDSSWPNDSVPPIPSQPACVCVWGALRGEKVEESGRRAAGGRKGVENCRRAAGEAGR